MQESTVRKMYGIADGSAQANISGLQIEEMLIPFPPLPEQRRIAKILGDLDDKIELNRKMNETLESMARALFKSWFVDFDPVRAKMDGRQPEGMDAETAALWPNKLVDSELGMIPEGWEVKVVGDLADIVGGSTPSTIDPRYWDGYHYWVTPKDLAALTFPFLLKTERRVTDAGLAKISSGLLPIGTLLLSSRAPIGYLAITEIPVAINQGFVALKPLAGISNLFLLHWSRVSHGLILSKANGSTFLEISRRDFRSLPIVAPTPIIMVAFDCIVRPLYNRLLSTQRESLNLTSLRDELLPTLVSGGNYNSATNEESSGYGKR